MNRLLTLKRDRRTTGVIIAMALAVVAAFGSTAVARAEGQFTFLQSGFTQELYGTAPTFFGGVAFAPNADVWVDFCQGGGSPLDRFNNSTTTPENGSNVHPLVAGSPFPSDAGCGLTNNPDGFLYSNTSAGVAQINASTAVPTGVVFGAPGNALGITTDPQTGNLVYVSGDGSIMTAPPGGSSSIFSAATTGSFIDGIAFDPTGNFLFVSNRTLNVVTIINRSGALVQNSAPIPGVPDGISFHASTPKFVVTNNNDGSMTRLDFPGGDFTMPPVNSVFASGGFRGDLSQVGPDSCIYLTQEGTRYDNGVTTPNNSIVRICPGFAPPPGVESALVLTPKEATDPAGGEHTVTATLTEEKTKPISGTVVTFAVTGVNAGVKGTCTTTKGAPDPTCETDETGGVRFTYKDVNGEGEDTINASATVHGETIHATPATKKWVKAEVTCPEKPPKVNVRWHYSAEGSAGSWSETREAKCGKTLTMGPQAMEGTLKVTPGKKIKAGYDFSLPGNNKPFTAMFTEGKVIFKVKCVSGAKPTAPTFTVEFPNQSYFVTGSEWSPSGNQSSPLVYQGEREVPPLCGTGKLSLSDGGTFSTFFTIH